MYHFFSGFSGSLASLGIGLMLWVIFRGTKKEKSYNLGPQGDPHAYEPIMNKYIRFMEFVIGIGTGSIVLIVGSSALHGREGRLPWFYASPLILITASVIYGISFMAYQILTYEDVLHEIRTQQINTL